MNMFTFLPFLIFLIITVIYLIVKKDRANLIKFLLMSLVTGWIWWTWSMDKLIDPLYPVKLLAKGLQNL
ncbi:hypothetical protein [Guptibacillus algicola]|uniref:hypothetical protein n=1 Tax=Guptibacillus algicola TaxID=225844 RepID=UPI001CD7899B|nr:hypothetical protein [Alkalihalobacillus algicola]MCA0987611.1 hypothetical protein [Alkalihalobacillus algicola]